MSGKQTSTFHVSGLCTWPGSTQSIEEIAWYCSNCSALCQVLKEDWEGSVSSAEDHEELLKGSKKSHISNEPEKREKRSR